MAKALYLEDGYLQECEAVVTSVKDGKFVILDRTIFYPNGGGQPFDTGKLIRLGDNHEFKVVYVGKFSGEISHEVSSANPAPAPSGEAGGISPTAPVFLQPGDRVKCVLDWERRYLLMRMHTAAHVLASLFCAGTGVLITGNQLGTDETRFDFDLENFDRSIMEQYVAKSNALFQQDIPVKSYFLARSEAMKIPGIVKLAHALPPEVDPLRIVEIVGVDIQADGGTHVRNLQEVGQIEITRAVNKGKSNRRVYFKFKAEG